jgi:hypothetical protein
VQNIDLQLENIKVEITSSYGIFEKYTFFVDKILEGSFTLTNFDFKYQLQLLKNLTEKDIDSIKIVVSANNEEIVATQFNLDVLPMDHFGGLQVLPQLLASYVTPNNLHG